VRHTCVVMRSEVFRILNIKFMVFLGVSQCSLVCQHLFHIYCTMWHHVLKDCDLKSEFFPIKLRLYLTVY
jgi:hypothetical protein